ncbi:P-loop containing nucleoside triphosphate hydrolase protein [Lophiotrema nucula]|uniref:P-loop containing nucleoside triphosphate hydrolase protein n=1 Tax=Lophiotrema nucula TaxID=690887 RepID=A0A6A5ZS48_9PLEO|nr:P-loop containing nucleoside triphosphate hydrolase protein [Lophiotrema nucula]
MALIRLLQRKPDGAIVLREPTSGPVPAYAILSHTWGKKEVTFQDIEANTGKCKSANTCYIDKRNAVELGAAINSMFWWYQNAACCYVYLSDVSKSDNRAGGEKAWEETLQELLAPATVEFFSKEGKRLGSRISLQRAIYEITEVPTEALRGQGEAYARLRLEEEIQKRQKGHGTAHVRDLRVSSSLPFPRNELFVGREDQLHSLQHFIDSDTPGRMTIYGLGGGGKSALALELAYRALVPAISRQSFELAFHDIGIRLRVPGITEDNADIKQLVKEALSSDGAGHWLMIVDNADDTGVLADGTSVDAGSARLQNHLPHSDKGKILFTTRSRKAAEELTPSHVLELDDMSKNEARQLLVRRLSKPALLDEEEAVGQLLESLEYLPLAIVQAAAFINSNNISVSEYLSLF